MFGQSQPVDYLKEDLWGYLRSARKHPNERSFQKDLRRYLRGMEYAQRIEKDFRPPQKDIPAGYEYRSKLDLEVGTPDGYKNIAVELKHDFGGANEMDRLERQLRDYSQVWTYIVVCSQGISRYEDWERISSKFQRGGGMFGNGQEIVFISDEPSQQQNQGSMNPFDNVSNPFDYF